MRKAQRWKKPVPLYDSKGKFLEYITHENGRAMVASGGADRKALFARISPAAYLKLCELAGEKTLAEALDELLRRQKAKEGAAK